MLTLRRKINGKGNYENFDQRTVDYSYFSKKKLDIKDGDYIHLVVEGEEIRLKKVNTATPLSQDDPMWELVGEGESGYTDVSQKHGRYLAEGEVKGWKK